MLGDVLDLLPRALGFVMALTVSVIALGGPLALGINLFNMWYFEGTKLGKIKALLIPWPVAALLLYFFWRSLRFMGGYIGSSEYPLEFVVKAITKLF